MEVNIIRSEQENKIELTYNFPKGLDRFLAENKTRDKLVELHKENREVFMALMHIGLIKVGKVTKRPILSTKAINMVETFLLEENSDKILRG